MDNGLPDFAGADEPAVTETAQPQEAAQPAAEPALEAPQPAPAEAAPAVEPEAPQPEQQPGFVPLAALLDERDRRQATEAEARRLREWRQQQEAEARRQPAPDRESDPEGYEAYRDQRFQAAMYDQKLTFSQRMAVLEHGADAVKAAKDWYDSEGSRDPYLDRKVAASEDPYGVVLAEWKRQKVLSSVDPNDLDAFLAWKAQNQPQSAAGAPAAPPARPAAPRPSIAAAPSAGASSDPSVKGGDDTYREMFGS